MVVWNRTYSLQALTPTGDFELAKQTLRLLRDRSDKVNGNGRIVHEITPDGAISNPGNTQETAQFVLTVGKVFEWTGDRDFAREMYPAMKRGIDWLLGEMDQDHDLFPEGYGIMEVSGLNAELIDVAVYTQQAAGGYGSHRRRIERHRCERPIPKAGRRLERKDQSTFWIEQDGTYADFYGSRSQAINAADGAIKQIRLKGEDKLTRSDKNLIAHYERQKAEFSAMPERPRLDHQQELGHRNAYGNRNRAACTRDRATGQDPAREQRRIRPVLSAVERQAMMTISTGVQAVAEGNYGRTAEAMWYVDRIVQTFNRITPGSISEMMPDYGCFTIAWTSYGIVLPLIEHVFGIRPDAANKTIVFEPHLPAGWEDISIEELPVGTNLISFSRTRSEKAVIYDIEARDDGWSFVLRPTDSSSDIHLRGKKNRVLINSTR